MIKQLALLGTTASGKSALALEIAYQANAVILSLDSLAIYKQINIASAKPDLSDLEKVKHFGVDEIYPNEPFSVGEFFKIYKRAKNYAKEQNKTLIITGGSGFYLKAMLSGLTPDVPKCAVPKNSEIYALASKIDPKFTAKFSQNDSYRLEKWYQIYKFSNTAPSLWLAQNTSKPLIKNLEIFEIAWDKDELNERIFKRTEQMIKAGLVNEAEFLFKSYGEIRDDKFYAGACKPLGSIGLKECAEFLRGEIKNINELKTLISTHTAQLAKRQRTFNRSQFDKKFVGSFKNTKNEILKSLNLG